MDYRAESDFSTLQRGQDVMADPARHQRALAHGRKQVQNIGRVLARGKVGAKTGRQPKRMAVR